jgi:hypothetical protein
MSPSIIHLLTLSNDRYVVLVNNFNYDDNYEPITPRDDHVWIDIDGNYHHMEPRDSLPPLFTINNNGSRVYIW